MSLRFKDFLTESDAFTEVVAELQNDPYKDDKPAKEKKMKLENITKVFDPVKWRKYLQYANAGNN